MTTKPVGLETLLAVRERLFNELPDRDQRQFLIGLALAQPDWALLQCPHAAQLPALQWKLAHLRKFKQQRSKEFLDQAHELQPRLRR